MDEIVLLGLNHTTAPVELRECLAFSQEETFTALQSLHAAAAINEALVISTCNRVEVVMTTSDTAAAVDRAKAYLAEAKNTPLSKFENRLYIYFGDEAVRHLFMVAASLDSMVVGEPQILGQVKEAYRAATLKKTTGVILNRLLHRTFFVAKRIRSETRIGDHAVSISYAAIELGKKIFGSLANKQALLIGAGEMAELAVEHLLRNKATDIFVANRTFERGVSLATRFNGKAIRFEEITNYLAQVDIIISSTGSSDFIITQQDIKSIMRRRRNRPLFLIDIAVPRDIDPHINRLNNAYVYDIDDLQEVIDENVEERSKEAVKGARIVDEAVIRFRQWYDSLEVVPTIVALRDKMDAIAQTEAAKTLQSLKHLSNEDCDAIHRMANAILNKILHDPTQLLKNHKDHGNKTIYLDITRKLFKLDE